MMQGRAFVRDDSGAVTVDWVALTAGIVLLGIMVAISVMEDSSGYLMDEFDSLNKRYAEDAVTVSELGRDIDMNN